MLERFALGATTASALPWQREDSGLSLEQAAAPRGIAEYFRTQVERLHAEILMLLENVGRDGASSRRGCTDVDPRPSAPGLA